MNQDKKQEQHQQQGRGGAALVGDGGVVERPRVSEFVAQHAVAEHHQVEPHYEHQRHEQKAEPGPGPPPLQSVVVV